MIKRICGSLGGIILILLVGVVIAQITAPVPTTFELASDNPKEFLRSNVSGTPMLGAAIMADPDTLPPIWLSATVEEVIDSLTVTLGVAMRYGGTSVNKTMTVNTRRFFLPPTAWGVIPDSIFRIALDNTRPLVKNEQFKLETREISLDRGQLWLTLIAGDSVTTDGDSVFGAAMRADWRGSIWYMITSCYSADSCQLKLGYQIRQKDGTWTGAAGETMSVITDSLVLVPGTATQKFVHVPSAAWVRPVVVGISLTDKVRIDTLKALNRVL